MGAAHLGAGLLARAGARGRRWPRSSGGYGARWFEARRAITGRRKTSYTGAAVDVLAAAPVLSATTLASILGIAVKNAIRILDELRDADIAIEVTHRSKRRLFGLEGLAPLRDAVRPPYRPDPDAVPGGRVQRWRTI